LMAIRLQKGRDTLLVAETLNPRYRAVLETYLTPVGVKIVTLPFQKSGELDLEALGSALNEKSVAVLIQSPNVLGVIEPTAEISRLAHEKGALVIQNGNPLAYALFASPGETGVDIAVGDTQPFGIPLQFGGPYAGYMATRLSYVRQLPGRLVGETVDTQGRKGYTLTLQAREQHIRREKALSNICTNQALMALSSLVAILWYGKEGVKELALTNYRRAAYLKSHLPHTLTGPVFNEFTVRFKRPLDEVKAHFRRHGIEPGWPCPLFSDGLIVAVTEKRTKADLDRYLEVAHDCI
jgi:glycine dehydrogenase subunit 1